jgi:serine protease Do
MLSGSPRTAARRLMLISARVLAAALLMPATALHAEIDRETQLRLAPSVMKIEVLTSAGYGLGSGVLIGPQELVTNCHVTRQAMAVNVLQGGLRHAATAQASSVAQDLCLLHVPGLEGQPVAMASAASLTHRQPLLGIGFSGGLGVQFVEGELVSLNRMGPGENHGSVIRSSNYFNSGASGGGLFDAQGRLVGVLTFRLRGGQAHYFSVPADWIDPLRSDPAQFVPVGPLAGRAFWEQGEAAPPFLRAASLAQSRQWAELQMLARDWHTADPRDVGAPLALGDALEQLGELADAESAFADAVALAPDDAAGWLRRGQLQVRLGRLTEARTTLARLSQLDRTLALRLAAMAEMQ